MINQKFIAVTESALPPLVLMGVYFVGCLLTIFNYVFYYRYEEAVYGASLRRAYLTFAILGGIVYALVSAVAWLWAAKYVTRSSDRFMKTAIGVVAIFVFHDMPCFIMEWHAILCCGWLNGFQGFVYIFTLLTCLFSFVFSWSAYTYIAAGWVQRTFGDGDGYSEEPQLKTGAVAVNILPPVSPGGMSSQYRGTAGLGSADRAVTMTHVMAEDGPMSPLVGFPQPVPAPSSGVRWSQPRQPSTMYSPRDEELRKYDDDVAVLSPQYAAPPVMLRSGSAFSSPQHDGADSANASELARVGASYELLMDQYRASDGAPGVRRACDEECMRLLFRLDAMEGLTLEATRYERRNLTRLIQRFQDDLDIGESTPVTVIQSPTRLPTQGAVLVSRTELL
jgi:hypothetical protein